jgi:CRISPR-associated protein Csm3
MSKELQLKGYLTLRGTLRCVTGLRIGSEPEMIEIGGLDNPIIRHPITKLPYIPGSSLKGKMRSLLELRLGKIDPRPYKVDEETGEVLVDEKGEPLKNPEYGEVHKPNSEKGWNCEGPECPICRLFGSNAGTGEVGPARLIVRDAELTSDKEDEAGNVVEGWKTKIRRLREKGEKGTEIKYENTINRINAMANPRQMERVPAGVDFDFEIGYRVFSVDGDQGQKDLELFRYVVQGLQLVEADTLGGSGSRGYGRVAFESLTLTDLTGTPIFENKKLDELHDFKLS